MHSFETHLYSAALTRRVRRRLEPSLKLSHPFSVPLVQDSRGCTSTGTGVRALQFWENVPTPLIRDDNQEAIPANRTWASEASRASVWPHRRCPEWVTSLEAKPSCVTRRRG
ncbi:unnamed protein product [Protopolystoma xenopodis]|uniref:Uncharacterized protein n=1 Tax=Protopolystoma xenopodis TaxID=117903 RepID=A0A3S5C774_9PLAT|nr:unnamed protein product [Protopolystoma xenopodis]